MSFIIKKKRFKFDVKLEVEELSSVTFVNGTLFAKVRLITGGTFTDYTSKVDVKDHRVRWESKFNFVCKMIANHNSGILEASCCRISIRLVMRGGKSYQKLGYADVDLSQFAGSGYTTRRYLLDGYNSKLRLDNSTLKLNITLSLLSGDPCFKVSKPNQIETLIVNDDDGGTLHSGNKGCDGDWESEDSLASGSSGFASLTLKGPGATAADVEKDAAAAKAVSMVGRGSFEPSHSRTASGLSNISKASGGQVITTPSIHNRTPSVGSPSNILAIHKRSESSSSAADPGLTGSFPRPSKRVDGGLIERRLDFTRVDPDDLVDNLIKEINFDSKDENDQVGLQLVVDKDGSTHLESQTLKFPAVPIR